MAHTKDVVLSVEARGFRTHITVENVVKKKKIGMGVQRLSTWVHQRRISSTSGKNMGLNGEYMEMLFV